MSEGKKLLILSSDESLERIKYKYKQYIDDPDYVYKLCSDEWLVMMKKITNPINDSINNNDNIDNERKHDDEQKESEHIDNDLDDQNTITVTNESRKNVFDPLCAKFRANILEVHKIINIETMKEDTFVCHEFYNYNTATSIPIMYEVGKTIKPDRFDSDLNNVCSNGIHYFKTIDRAFYYRNYDILPTYTGRVIDWFDNGQKKLEGLYVKGKMNGLWTYWDLKGRVSWEEHYSHGNKCGIWVSWYENGNKAWEKHYCEGALGGIYRYVSWYENENIEAEGNYITNDEIIYEDKQDGIWTYWTTNGQKICDKKYIDGVEQNI